MDPTRSKNMKRMVTAVLAAGVVLYCFFDFGRTMRSANIGHDHWYCQSWFYYMLEGINTLLSFGCWSACKKPEWTEDQITDCRRGCYGLFVLLTIIFYLFWQEVCKPTLG
jgi:hypothetical protein